MPFERRLPKEALDYLRTKPGWWLDVLDAKYQSSDGKEHRLLIAVRDDYLSAYANGRTIYEIRFVRVEGRIEPRCQIHRRYVLGPNAEAGHLIFNGSQFLGGGQESGVPYEGKKTLENWIKNAVQNHIRRERAGVGEIAARYPNVIDVEVALPPNGLAVLDAPPGPPQMDITCLERSDDGVRLAFYEAKLFGNSDLRANNLKPPVLTQLKTYEDALSDPSRREQVIEAYRNACVILRDIAEMRGTAVSSLVHEVAKNPWLHLDLDPKPRLIVFGYGSEQAGDRYWPRHERALRDSGYKLLLGNSAEDAFVRDEATIEQDERARLVGLARFGPIFTAPDFQFGTWYHSPPNAPGVLTFPSYSLSDAAQEFVQAAYKLGWVKQFQWPEWKEMLEGRGLMESPDRIAEATPDQLAKLLTVYIRGDRFNEGLLNSAFESGLLTTVVKRAEALLRTQSPNAPADPAPREGINDPDGAAPGTIDDATDILASIEGEDEVERMLATAAEWKRLGI